MKHSLSFALEIFVKLGTCLAACIGCSSKNPPCPDLPREVHWRGQETGYQSATSVPSGNDARSDGKK